MSHAVKNGVSPRNEPGNGTPSVYTETTPLLTESLPADLLPQQAERDGTNEPVSGKDDDRPMDKFQIFVLCFIRIADPVSFFCIIPFINQMIFETGNIVESDVGFYTGLIVRLGPQCSLSPLTVFKGVTLLRYSNAHHDSMGTHCRQIWSKARFGDLSLGYGLHSVSFWVQPNRLANGFASLRCRAVLWIRRVRPSLFHKSTIEPRLGFSRLIFRFHITPGSF
jgi:hypothetical protein